MMYFFWSLTLLFLILLPSLFRLRQYRIIRRVRSMPEQEKLQILSLLTGPAGFSYQPEQGIFTSRQDAWQRVFGYRALYDETAPFGQMVFDCEPFYFDYQDRTWLIELWKGQYGINTGAEIGIYHADTLLSPDQYSTALFQAVSDEEMLPLGLELSRNGDTLFQISGIHWWLTGFVMGTFSRPEELRLKASVTFPDYEMMEAFVHTLTDQDHCCRQLCCRTPSVTLDLTMPKYTQPCSRHRLRCRISQWKNHLFCRIYCRITRPFDTASDKLLYLYFFLPAAFRRMVQIRKPRCYRAVP